MSVFMEHRKSSLSSKKFIIDKIEHDKIFDERKHTSCYSSRHLIHIPSFRIVNLQCCGGHFSNITLNDAKARYRSPYPFWGRPQHVLGRSFVEWVVHI